MDCIKAEDHLTGMPSEVPGHQRSSSSSSNSTCPVLLAVAIALSATPGVASVAADASFMGRLANLAAQPRGEEHALDGFGSAVNRAAQPLGEEHALDGFGRAVYPDWPPPPTWQSMSGSSPHDDIIQRLGAPCDAFDKPENGSTDVDTDVGTIGCGEHLVCRDGLCRQCVVDAECPFECACVNEFVGMSLCEVVEKQAWARIAGGDPGEIGCTLLVLLASVLAGIAGISGGGVYVPSLLLLSGAPPESAVPLSQCLTTCVALVNVLAFVSMRHPGKPAASRIDYDCVALFEPMLVLGITFGVLLHEIVPRWLVLLLLCITLGAAMWRVAKKGLQQFSDETGAPSPAAGHTDAADEPFGTRLARAAAAYVSESTELMSASALQLIVIVAVWAMMLMLSFRRAQVCTVNFAVGLVLLTAALGGCAAFSHMFVISDAGLWKGDSDSKTRDAANLGFIALGAGALGGTCGLGGGIIVGPVLLELGLPAEVVQATTSLFVLLSSSIATVQFAVADRLVWHYALWYGAVTVAAAVLGLRVCDVSIRLFRRRSIIPLSIAAMLLASLVALSVAGSLQVAKDFQEGDSVAFSTAKLCEPSGPGIQTIEVEPMPRLPHWSEALEPL